MNRFSTVVVVVLALVLLVLAGPKVQIDDAWSEVSVPSEIDAWLSTSELAVPKLRPALQKQVLWADSSHQTTEYAVVYLHGFSSSRMETAPFSDSVAAALGANLFYTRLRGHGQDDEAFGTSKAQEWIQDTVEAIRVGEAIGEKVILVGTSTGATLAAWAAMEPELSDHLEAMVWVSPNFGPKDARSDMMLWPWGRTILRTIVGDTYSWTPQNELHAASGTQSYSTDVILEMIGLVDLVQHKDFGTLNVPVLMIYSPGDQVVEQNHSLVNYEALGSSVKDSVRVLRATDKGNHVILGDALGAGNTIPVARRVVEFVRSLER